MSAASYLEAGIVADGTDDPDISAQLDVILATFSVEIVPVTAVHARAARAAYRRFGKGRHPARLNFGDCFAYALASTSGEALLFKGADFAATDILSAT